ncbi:hypothetical protein C0Q58_14280 [Streptomyces albidoflavus]|uniref:hypothetical protein n=1 Tax=Streptomyces albidoflavus TaxID=1886 RepID=UPI00101E6AB2|nr:hypothetical protein [Streptomyces albidoflavus]RZD62907.1 hypothetical protein C0Q58_14280 [Streptomyces albidoflavus]
MRLLTGADLTAFYNDTNADMLVLFLDKADEDASLEGTPFGLLDYNDIQTPTFTRPEDLNTEEPIATSDGVRAKILVERATIEDDTWWEDAIADDGTLAPDTARELADTLNHATGLDQIIAVHEARTAATEWEKARAKADQLALRRAQAVTEVARLQGQTMAGRTLGLDQSTVNKLVRKARAAEAASQ